MRGTRGWQRGGQPPWRRVARWRRTVNRWRLVTAGALAFTAPTPLPPFSPSNSQTTTHFASPRSPPHFRASRKRSYRERRVFGHLSIIFYGSSIVTCALLKNIKKILFIFFYSRKKINFREKFKKRKFRKRKKKNKNLTYQYMYMYIFLFSFLLFLMEKRIRNTI